MNEFPKTYDSGIRLDRQDRSEDCWADCTSGILNYLGIKTNQDEVRTKVIGDKDAPMSVDGILAIFNSYGVSCLRDIPLSPERLWEEVTSNPIRPVMLGYEWYRGGGHVALVIGAREWTKRYLIQDPFFGPGELSYVEIAEAYGIGRWTVAIGRFALERN